MQKEITLITYTTTYRKGGAKFKRVANTMERSYSNEQSPVMVKEVNSKAELKAIFMKSRQRAT